MTYNESIKKSIYKWRVNNVDKFNEVCRRGMARQYEINGDAKRAKNLARYYRKQEFKIMCRISVFN